MPQLNKTNIEKPKVEVSYSKASLSKRMIASVIDLCLIFFTCIVLFTCFIYPIRNLPIYTKQIDIQNSLRIESNLYVDENTTILNYASNDENLSNYSLKKDYLSSKIEAFYANKTFFSSNSEYLSYQERKLEAKSQDGLNLFKTENDNIVETNQKPEEYYNFYYSEIENYCFSYLFNCPSYGEATSTIFLIIVISLLIFLVVSFLIYIVILPTTCFKRGRQTIGMKMFKIALIGVDGMNVKLDRYLCRCLFTLSIMYFLDFFSFLIPLFISLGMMYISKTNQNLTDYVFNQYYIDCKDDDIYLDQGEYFSKKENLKEISLTNKDISLKEEKN